MGAGIVVKRIDDTGEAKYVRLSGIEKAQVYEMLAKFGIYEMEPHERTIIDGIPVEEHSEVEAFGKPSETMLKTGLEARLAMMKTDATTMHCCEAAEILFEDIT